MALQGASHIFEFIDLWQLSRLHLNTSQMTFHSATCTLSLPLTLSFLKFYLNHFHYYIDHMLKLRVTQIIAFAKRLRDFLKFLLLTTNVSQSVVMFSPLFTNSLLRWFDNHIVIMTIFSQPQFKHWPRFVPQSFTCQ